MGYMLLLSRDRMMYIETDNGQQEYRVKLPSGLPSSSFPLHSSFPHTARPAVNQMSQ